MNITPELPAERNAEGEGCASSKSGRISAVTGNAYSLLSGSLYDEIGGLAEVSRPDFRRGLFFKHEFLQRKEGKRKCMTKYRPI